MMVSNRASKCREELMLKEIEKKIISKRR